MRNVVVSAGQSLLDVCLQELGSTGALFDLADANGLPITAVLSAGQRLQVPEASALAAPEIAAYYAARQYRVNVADPTHNPAPVVPPGQPLLRDFLPADVNRLDFY
jgi:hypothetical protein